MGKINVRVKRSGGEKILSVEAGGYALDILADAGISVYAPCGGSGRCGGCRAKILGGIRIDGNEAELLTDSERESGVHLLCRTALTGDCEIDLRGFEIEVQTEGASCGYTLSPLAEGKLGVAVDIGTTTVAVFLCDMINGKTVATRSFLNPQSSFGADVISRMSAIISDFSNLEKQKTLIISAINSAVSDMCAEASTTTENVCAAVLCGNTVMEHIAAGEDPSGIAKAPFTPKSLFGSTVAASDAGLEIKPDAPVLFAPCVASYVGGDISCGAAAVGLDGFTDNVLYIDVGTNGEIGFVSDGKIKFCSAAAGPAFEGAHIARGMAGETGAVSEVFLSNGEIRFKTIGGAVPRGICGSGVLDAVAVMLDTGILDETGRICPDKSNPYNKYVGKINGSDAFIIDAEHDIYITGADVREVQLAKSAICAGAKVLCAENKVDRVIIAGGFGAHMNPESAVKIGLLPRVETDRISSVGNAAGAGARALLLSAEMRDKALKIKGESEYIELSSSAEFMDLYIDEMMFPEDA